MACYLLLYLVYSLIRHVNRAALCPTVMPLLDPYTVPLTRETAAHLLRRATFGPTKAEITSLVGQTASQAVQTLISNINYNPPPPVEMDENFPGAGQPYLNGPFNGGRNFQFGYFIKYWWLGLMTQQTNAPNLIDKLTMFWQNHFVTTRATVDDYRFVDRYIRLLRGNALGNFRSLLIAVTKDPAMLRYLNGNENKASSPNENYARELQELFTCGAVDFAGAKNYTEDDVKAAARVLTGWSYTNFWVQDSTSFTTVFTPADHDSTNKTFSAKHNNTVITGRTGATAGDAELNDLVTMLLNHPQTAKFICRKLYRFYVNPHVTQTIEDTVIAPLATFFASAANNWAIQPVVVKLLTSQLFFDASNRGAIVKSPADLLVGSLRFFDHPVPVIATDYVAFRRLMEFVQWRMEQLQMDPLDQPTVFGYEPFYQTGFSKNWINTNTVAQRNEFTDALLWRWYEIKPGYNLGIDVLAWARSLQPDFSNVYNATTNPTGTPPITCEQVLAAFTADLFVFELPQTRKDFLIDTMMMQSLPRTSWLFEWNAYRSNPTHPANANTVTWRLQLLMRYALRLAEYHVC
ncbi:protein of unknown function DUF1800 [Fibrella aestuarina BUZ 2]|uniref:DUF1800 domain-containing protein n=2 Tax=Fibrella TaxID=861914 RepID=I0K4U6_9BACT|nr:protein of unknown function DUF1800 [Fibrella aestuarina BUZ 2]